jgi:hypothetical protein
VANPSNFLRGSGIATQDVRDVGQEMYLQHVQTMSRQQHQQSNNNNNEQQSQSSSSSSSPTEINTDMPPDLLKFIQDVGPAKQTIDKDYTSSRLLENKEELENVMKSQSSSSTSRRRQRMQMPLMGDDETFTTEKNTNFARTTLNVDDDTASNDPSLFGLDHLGLYELLLTKDTTTTTTSIDDFYDNVTKDEEERRQGWSENDRHRHKERLRQALNVLDLPVLLLDNDHNILGLYPKDVPGPEVKSLTPIPDNKAMLVLRDLSGQQTKKSYSSSDDDDDDDGGTTAAATEKLLQRRRERKMKTTGAGL